MSETRRETSNYHISLYILIPLIFSGTCIIGVAGTYWITVNTMKVGDDPVSILWKWGIGIALFAFVCGLLISWFVLDPVKRFIRVVEDLHIIPAKPGARAKPQDEVQYFEQVFDQLAKMITKTEALQRFPSIIAHSNSMLGLLSQVLKVAPTESTILITGESGTGKELIANALVENSLRREKPFIKLNCAAIPEGLLESELFGHEKGAFTGAVAKAIGVFERADGGTILLDEIADMPLATQAKLLRVLQEREFQRVGGRHTIKVDVRILAATNKDLHKMVKSGAFREDLYYRLHVVALPVPALRDRKEDIPALVEHFLSRSSPSPALSALSMELLMAYSWPGNVRELQNAMERAAVMAEEVIEPTHLPVQVRGGLPPEALVPSARDAASLDDRLKEIEKGLILAALKKCNGIQTRAAEILGINSRSLLHRIKKHGISTESFK